MSRNHHPDVPVPRDPKERAAYLQELKQVLSHGELEVEVEDIPLSLLQELFPNLFQRLRMACGECERSVARLAPP